MAEDDKELFESAFQDEAPEQVATPEPETPQERPRDEHGRFAPKAQEEAQQPAPVLEKPEPKTEGIPSWRLKEEAEARRAADDRANRLERELEQLRQQAKQPRQAEPEEPAKPPPEPWDPGYTEYVQKQAAAAAQERYQNAVLAMAEETAYVRHTQEVVEAAKKAFNQAIDSGTLDQADYARVKNAPNPYSAAVEWHKRQQVFSTVGNDPNAWLEKQLEERLKDPAYQAQLIERIRGTAQPGTRPVTQLPPSLNKATRAAASAEDDDSDAGLLKSALRR